MSKIQVGKVSLTYQGAWEASKTYAAQTCVVYQGSSYVSLIECKGITPSNDGYYWRLLASKGDKGDRGTDGTVSFGSLTASQKQELKGQKGNTGTTYIPSIDSDGTLKWTNNGGLSNPNPINLKGPQGEKGVPGDMFFLRIGTKEDKDENGNSLEDHLVAIFYQSSYVDLFKLGEDGHLYINI